MRTVYGNTTNGISGSSQITLTAGARTSTTTAFTSPSSQAGINGIAVYRNLGTADCVVRFYSITASDGTLLWSPTQNLDTYSGILNLTTSTSSGSGGSVPSTIEVTSENDALINFALLFAILLAITFSVIFLLRPFYARK